MSVWLIPWIILWIIVGYFVLSVKKVDATEIAAVKFLGRLWKMAEPGPVLVPLGFCTLHKSPRRTVQMEIPGEPEQVVRDDRAPLGPGQVRAVRFTHARAEDAVFIINGQRVQFKDLDQTTKDEVLSDPLNRRLTSEANVAIRFRIGHDKDQYFCFVRNIGSVAEAQRQIEDTVVATLQGTLSEMTLGHANQRLQYINEETEKAIRILIGAASGRPSWGVQLEDVQIKPFNTGHTVAQSQADAAAAVFNKEKTLQDAEGAKQKRIKEGEAEAEAERVQLEKRAQGLALTAEVLKTDEGRLAAQLETTQALITHSQYSILPDAYGFIAGIANALPKASGSKKK